MCNCEAKIDGTRSEMPITFDTFYVLCAAAQEEEEEGKGSIFASWTIIDRRLKQVLIKMAFE